MQGGELKVVGTIAQLMKAMGFPSFINFKAQMRAKKE